MRFSLPDEPTLLVKAGQRGNLKDFRSDVPSHRAKSLSHATWPFGYFSIRETWIRPGGRIPIENSFWTLPPLPLFLKMETTQENPIDFAEDGFLL